jgi:hypothetical protein
MGDTYFAPTELRIISSYGFYEHFAPDGAKKVGVLFTLKSADTSSAHTSYA